MRYILFPFSVVYGFIVLTRNFLFDLKILKSSSFDVKTILVGNISAGGTGKTPHIEYLIRLLSNEFHIATLSRGYGRKTNGFVKANENSTAQEIGDEPLQFFNKFPGIQVAVDAKRVNGVIELMSQDEPPEIVLLDDAFQHRQLKAGLSILLMDMNLPFYKDFMLPTGNLREFPRGKKRADAIIITKCNESLTDKERAAIRLKINSPETPIFFSQIEYGEPELLVKKNEKSIEQASSFVVVTGIANPKPLLNYLTKFGKEIIHLNYPDHHPFSAKDIAVILEKYKKDKNRIVLTTEKDAMRLRGFGELKNVPLFYLPIKVAIQKDEKRFNKLINDYVRNN